MKSSIIISPVSDNDESRASCASCGQVLDVTQFAPFSRVICPSCNTEIRVKTQFGPYTLLRRHAIGGMSMVFVARDAMLDREVALKILSEEFSQDQKRISAFENEARITASISHPHVVKVYKTGIAFGRFYIAMELVPGGHFEKQITERKIIPEKEALALATQVASGLRAAHNAGLIHRDIKPGNILLDSEGNAKIVDFGLALVTKDGVAKAEELWATPYYVPPETIEGKAEDYRSDIYAFGATFYHALCGVPPCTEQSMDTNALREAKLRILPLSEQNPLLTDETINVIENSMAYKPESRFNSYDELLEALGIALQSAARNLKTPETLEHAKQAQVSRRRSQGMQNALIGSGLLCLLATIIGSIWYVMKPSEPEPRIITQASPIKKPEKPIPNLENKGLDIAANFQLARREFDQKKYASAEKTFVTIFQNQQTQEPTKTLCGIEALNCLYLTSQYAEIPNLLEQLQNKSATPDIKKIFLALSEHPPIATNALKDIQPAYLPALHFAIGIKEWEQGLLDSAVKHFQLIQADDPLLKNYPSLAKEYLSDYLLIQKNKPTQLPDSPAACQEAARKIEELLSSLQSKGRSKFILREWLLLLKRHEKSLSQ